MSESRPWTFLTNHGSVLLCIAQDPNARLRDIAEKVQVTERAAQQIVSDLVRDGYVSVERVGRRNRYEVHTEKHLRKPIVEDRRIKDLLEALFPNGSAA